MGWPYVVNCAKAVSRERSQTCSIPPVRSVRLLVAVLRRILKFGPGSEGESVQFSSVTQSCPTLCNPMDCSTPGFPVHHQLPECSEECGDPRAAMLRANEASVAVDAPRRPPAAAARQRTKSNPEALPPRRPLESVVQTGGEGHQTVCDTQGPGSPLPVEKRPRGQWVERKELAARDWSQRRRSPLCGPGHSVSHIWDQSSLCRGGAQWTPTDD